MSLCFLLKFILFSLSVKQDFVCQKELLINEMKYFADYLSNETDKWEDVDISVHCDVYIFDWLMRYVKQESVSAEDKPKLGNIVSVIHLFSFQIQCNMIKYENSNFNCEARSNTSPCISFQFVCLLHLQCCNFQTIPCYALIISSFLQIYTIGCLFVFTK